MSFLRDLRIAVRSLSRVPSLWITVALTLALGIGANAAIFSVVRAVLLRPLANRDEARLLYIRQSAPGLHAENVTFSIPEIDDLGKHLKSISELGTFSEIDFTMQGLGQPRAIPAGVVDGHYFEVMGLRPILGRLLGPVLGALLAGTAGRPLQLGAAKLSVLLALGPFFITFLFFDTTKRFFESWIAQMANYAFITILTVLVSALMMGVVSSAAQQAAAQGGGIQIADAVRVCLAAGLTFLVMRQVMPMAMGLASGVALSSYGMVSALLAWGFAGAARNISRQSGQFARGLLMDQETSRWDSFPRKAGFALRQRLIRRENVIRRGI